MLKPLLIRLLLILVLSVHAFPQTANSPSITPRQLIFDAEFNPALEKEAKNLAIRLNLPVEIYTLSGIYFSVKAIERNQPVYLGVPNIANPFRGSSTLFYNDIEANYDLRGARINFGNGKIINPRLGYSEVVGYNPLASNDFVMVINSTDDVVVLLNAQTGDIVDPVFIGPDANLQTPKSVQMHPQNFVTIADQLSDVVTKYDTSSGSSLGIFAPIGGVNTTILDNLRGHVYRSNGNLLVTVGGGGNINSIAEFDQSGNYLGQFISTGLGGLDSPFDIIFRDNDALVSAYGTGKILSYSNTGAFNSEFSTSLVRPQQIYETVEKYIAVADFGVGGGIIVLSETGTLLNLFPNVQANRGIFKLGNGNYLTTNGQGVYEVNGTTGGLVRTIIAGKSCQYFGSLTFSVIPVELVSFNAVAEDDKIVLKWLTSTETNNFGFEVQRSFDGINFDKIGFVNGYGTTTSPKYYSFEDRIKSNRLVKYRLKQTDFDGSFEFSNIVEVSAPLPAEYELLQNFPNPFSQNGSNSITNIEFYLPEVSNVKLEVFSSTGEKISTLIENEIYAAGKHTVRFNGQSLSSGVYFYRINASGNSNFSSLKKMIITK
ncbi:MAG: T9SS type A sorting domain-containing protein [Ignavibacteriaceae bacterium]|nr:T9SS type A sorting domain-containing protein [Ignavibacteriaceae bacterium]